MKSAAYKTLVLLILVFSASAALAGFNEGVNALTSKDYAKAIGELRPLGISGNASAQRLLGYVYDGGFGAPKDLRQAVFWYRKAADQGDDIAQFSLGRMYLEGRGVTKDELQGAMWLRKAAEQGDAVSQNSLGALHLDGRGVPIDEQEAAVWFRKAAEQGNADGQFNLGVLCVDGRGVPKDEQQAARWIRKAADQGHAPAQGNLGSMFASGLGVRRDDQQAVTWYRKSAEQGNGDAQFNLGAMYDEGRGVPKDDQQAVAWYRKAAEQGNASGQTNLGVSYRTGRGVPKDEQQAYFWFLLAAAKGIELARANRDIVEAKLTLEQRAGAQASARVWRPGVSDADASRAPEKPTDSSVAPDSALRAAANATGSGFRVGGDLIVTNQHVVQDCQRVAVGGAGTARVVANDVRNDLALLSAAVRTSAAATIRAGRPQIGEQVVVAGYPLRGLLSGLNVTAGNLSSLVGMAGDTRFVQISAPVQPGNSGGPLLDASGNVIGVVVSKLNAVKVAKLTGDIPQNVNFAITASVLRGFLDANGVEYKSGTVGPAIATPEVARKAQAITVLIECWK